MRAAAQSQTPTFSLDDVRALAADLYGIHGDVRPLPSERDQNFALFAETDDAYVLKIANGGEEAATLACQNQAMTHVAERVGHAPVVKSTLAGQAIATVTAEDGACYYVRLISYVPGKPLGTVRPHSPELLRDVGARFGRIVVALHDFDHPAARREFDWDLRQGRAVVERYAPLLPPAKQAVVARCLAHYDMAVSPLTDALPQSVIHGDGNDYNVLVETEGWSLRVSGVIDYGDLVYSWTVGELAIAAAYAMLDKRDPLTAAAHVTRGFHGVHPLGEAEADALYGLIRLRLCTSMVMAARQRAAAPENVYLDVSQEPVWALLQQLDSVPTALATGMLRHACGLAPASTTELVLAWLASQRDSFHPVVDADLHSPDQLVIDLSVASPLLTVHPTTLPPGWLTRLVEAEMAVYGKTTALGPYGEARFIYDRAPFFVVTEELPEGSTRHLGIDIFRAPGAPVYAPLAGTVHSLADNAAPLDYGPTVILRHATGDGTPFYTLYGHLAREALARLAPGQPVAAGQQIGVIGTEVVNGGWPPHLHVQLMVDLLDHTDTFPGVAAPRNWAVWSSFSPDPNVLLGIPDACFPRTGQEPDAILAARRELLGRNLSVSYREPVKIVRGWRQFLYDEEGRAYLDGVNNVSHVGHGHPHVVSAAQRQLPVLNTNTRYLHDNIIRYAERLLGHFPAPLGVVFFVCSGSEANELALRLARTYTDRQDIIMLDAAYHGNTQAMVDISPYKHDGPGGQGAPGWAHKALMPDPYRGVYKGYEVETGKRYAAHVQCLVAELAANGQEPAAFIAESVLGCGGQIVLPAGYLAAAFEHVRGAGGVCIADEVQVGFGRVGSHFWGFETQGVVPDIVTLGKPIGNGHPLGAVVTTSAIADAFANGMEYFNTFGGNPVSCAIGEAVLDVIEGEKLQAHAAAVGGDFLAGLRELQTQHELIGDVRGLGLFVGVELVHDRTTLAPAPEHAAYIANRMRDHGIFISTDGPLHNVLKLKPPLPFSHADAARVVATLDRILQETPIDDQSTMVN